MNMKRFFIAGFIVLSIALLSQSAVASQLLQAVLYPARITLDGEPLALPEGQPMLLYNEKAYVPLRYFSELAGIGVSFSGAENTIKLSRNADEHVSAVYDDILFTIHTAKKLYTEAEPISIWGSAEYIGEGSSIEVIGYSTLSGPRIIHANITDKEGFHIPFGFDDIGRPVALKKNKPMVWDLSTSINTYLYVKSGSNSGLDSFKEILMETGKINRLPAGQYTISALIRYELGWGEGNKEQQLTLDIEVR
ncbi:hypothetical protein [Paenibacillus sp. YN15]|uniref:hypothetical protein n=1 Tax=Paenibacillus sp. YN15 TaxID=1742774 RepID=UPI000DCBB37F|nr:hypothetical protein [Paenibacillus sp. YN15]RAV01232.1 hypothetical protein DQG13_12685 [Paenibacillus sp. YN15]